MAKKNPLDKRIIALGIFIVVFAGLFIVFKFGALQEAIGTDCPADSCAIFDFGSLQWRGEAINGGKFGTTTITSGTPDMGRYTTRISTLATSPNVVYDGSISYNRGGGMSNYFLLRSVNLSLSDYSTFTFNSRIFIAESGNPGSTSDGAFYRIGLVDARNSENRIDFLKKDLTYPGGSAVFSGSANIYGFQIKKSVVNPSRWSIVSDSGESSTNDVSSLGDDPQIFVLVYMATTETNSVSGKFELFSVSEPASAPAPTTPVGCESHNPDCPSGFTCSNNLCLQNPLPSGGCESHNPDCQAGYVCVNNSCNQIPLPPQIVIQEAPNVSAGCQYHNPDCPSGYVCNGNLCLQRTVAPVGSQQGCQYHNPDCPSGYECKNNLCNQQVVVEVPVKVDNTILYMILGGILVVSLILILYFTRKKKRR